MILYRLLVLLLSFAIGYFGWALCRLADRPVPPLVIGPPPSVIEHIHPINPDEVKASESKTRRIL